MTSYTRAELVSQPIGYWSGEAYRRIAQDIRQTLASDGLTQPQWWVLGRLADTTSTWTRAELIDLLTPYSSAEEGRDVGEELDDLVDKGWAKMNGDEVVITDEGNERLRLAGERNRESHRAVTAGVSDEEYALTIDVLRRMVGNLGGDASLP